MFFISYSRLDLDQCVRLSDGLSGHGIDVHVDEVSIAPGSSIHDRIRELIQASDVTICLVSGNSLKSLWVIWEIRGLVENSAQGKFLPAYLDKEFTQDRFVGDVQRQVETRLQTVTDEMKARLDKRWSVEDLSAVQASLHSLLNDLPTVVRRLREICSIDLTQRNFENGFGKIYRFITGREAPAGSIPIECSLDSASFADRRREIEDHVAANELPDAAKKTMDLLYDFFGNDKDAVRRATRLSGQIQQLTEAYQQEAQKPAQLPLEFIAGYNEKVFTYAEELLRLIPVDLNQRGIAHQDSRQMIRGIESESAKLRKEIAAESVGFESRFLTFVRAYSADAALERAAVMANLRLSTLTGASRDAVKDQLYDLLQRVVDTYSPQAVQELAARRARADFDSASKYAERKTLAYRCRDLRRSFGRAFTLGPIHLEIRRGDIAGIVGENGSGKTTLFRLIAGELGADGGDIDYPRIGQSSAKKISWTKVKSSIAYVPQELLPWLGNLKTILQYEAAIHGVRGAENDYEVSFVVERLGLGAHLRKRWNQLSGGYKFRFALARALVCRPDLMILDEPLTNLDVNAQLAMLRDIKSMATSVSQPIAVLLSSQHLHEVEAIADHILFLRNGRALFNDQRVRLGDDREENVYELACRLPVQDVQRAIRGRFPIAVSRDGLSYTLTTETGVSAKDVLQVLLNAGVEIQYFRDISRSTKRLFRGLS